MVVSKDSRYSARVHQTLLSSPFFLSLPLLLCSFFLLWLVFRLLSLCWDHPPHICSYPALTAKPHESRAPLSQRCNCSWQSKSFSGSMRSHTVMLQMPAQMPAESRTAFHLSRLKDFFVGESSWILSWDKSVFWPICFAFLSHSFWRENKVGISAETPGQQRETVPPWVRNGVISPEWGIVTFVGLFKRPHLLRFHLYLAGNSWSYPEDYRL